MCDCLAPAIPQDLCVCTDLSCAASCDKVRSHPLWQWGETSVPSSQAVADAAQESPSAQRSHPPKLPSSTRVENAMLCHGFTWAWTACLEGTCQASLAQPPSHTCEQFPPYPSSVGVVPCLGLSQGHVTNWCFQVFLLSVEMCLQAFWR